MQSKTGCPSRQATNQNRNASEAYIPSKTFEQEEDDPHRTLSYPTRVRGFLHTHLLEQKEQVSLKVFRVDRPRVMGDAPKHYGRAAVHIPRNNERYHMTKTQQRET